MKKLPIFTSMLLALVALGWLVHILDSSSLLAEAVTLVQAKSEEQDAAVAEPPSTSTARSAEALAVLQEARQKLFDLKSVQAQLRETVSMGGRKFRAEGTYVAGRYPKLRLTFKIDLGGTRGELLEVCDGQILWTVQKIVTPGDQKPEEQVARTVINDVVEAVVETQDVPELALIAGLGVGGLPSLLAALERSMTFEAVRELEEDGHRFTVIQGRWNADYLERLTGGDPDIVIPDYIPDHVRIYFNAETKFPTRILYLKETAPDARTFTALLSLEFWDVVLEGPVREELFRYAPPELTKVRDRTRDFLQMIEATAEKTRSSEAVRSDGSVPVND